MTGRYSSEYIDINIGVLEAIDGPLPFDVYIQRAENKYTRLFPKNEEVDQSRFKAYREGKGVQDLYVHRDDYKQYLLYVEKVANGVIENAKNSSSGEVINAVKEMVDLTMFDAVVNLKIDQSTVENAASTIKGCVDVLSKDPKSLIKLFQLMSTHPYVIRHSLTTAIFSIMLAKRLELESDKSLILVGLGAFLHDLGMSRLAFDVEEKEELNPEEWKALKEHPQLGKRLLDGVKTVPSEVGMIVLQHHEQPNGAGYPDGVHDKEIYFLAKIVAIADSFSALISKRPYREEPFSPSRAIAIMRDERGKFDPKMLETFSAIFITIKSPSG